MPNAGFARTPEATGRGFAAPDNDVLRAEHPVESQSWHPATKVFSHCAKSEGCFIKFKGRWAVEDRPPSVLAPGTALRLHLCRALSSVRVASILAMRRLLMQPSALPKFCVAEPFPGCHRVL